MANFFSCSLARLWNVIALIFFERRACALCQVELAEEAKSKDCKSNNLCHDCLSFFQSLTEVRTTLIGDDENDVIECFASGYYSGPLQEAIYQIKYLKRPELAQSLAFTLIPPTMALLSLRNNPENADNCQENFILVPVPLHPSKLKERGFNQAEELAFHLSEQLKIKMQAESLRRIRPTRAQFGLSRSQRRRNLEGAFQAAKSIRGKNVILVDDVLTSGATIYECALAVVKGGGTVVGAITLARARWQKRESAPDERSSDARTCVPASSLQLLL